jgi:chromosome segregation ATPase
MLFAKKIVQTVATIPEAEPDASRSSLPVDSVISKAPSLAPSQAPRAGYFSKWTGRPAPDYSVAFTAAASPPVDPIVKELTLKNAKLQDDNDQLKEVSYFNRLTLQKLANDFDSKDQECTRLHAAIRALNADICEKDQNIESLDEKLLSTQGTNSVADKLSAQNTAMLVNSLNQERSLTSELQRSITEKDDQLSALIISLNSTQSSHASLYQERTQLSQALAQARTTIPSLQNENNALASRAAASENAHAKLAAFIPALRRRASTRHKSTPCKRSTRRLAINQKLELLLRIRLFEGFRRSWN